MSTATKKSDNQSLVFVILVTLMATLALMPSDMYLPALPLIRHDFLASIPSVQLTMSAFFFGAAISQVLIGPFVDRLNFRLLGLLSIVIFILATIYCAAAGSLTQLIVARFLQACGAGFAVVIARAAVTKNFDEERASHVFLIMSPIIAVSPAISPVIGGFITRFFGWRAVFVFIALIALLILVFALKYLFVPKDDNQEEHSLHPLKVLKTYGTILKHRCFSTYLATRCGVDASYFGYITASPFIFYHMGYSAAEIGNFYIAIIITFVSTATLTKRIMTKDNKDLLMIVGLGISIVGGILLLTAGLMGYHYAFEIIIPASIMTAGYGFTGSLSWAEAMAQFPEKAGSASSLVGFFPLVSAALSAGLVHVITNGSVIILAAYMLVLLSIASTILLSLMGHKRKVALQKH